MKKDKTMNKFSSFMWGVAAFIVGWIVGAIVPLPLVGLALAVLLYFLYLKKEGVNVIYFALGYILLNIIVLALE